MKKLKKLFSIFFVMFKIGLFTFGGGYAMIAIIESELVEKRKWIDHNEFLDIIAIAESSPGPIAINTATYVGYKLGGFFGSLFCTLGVVLPSFIIIYIISFFYNQFLALKYVQFAFKGIQACVAYLILSAGIRMLKSLKKTPMSITLTVLTISCMVVLDFLSKNISAIFYILIGGAVGIFIYVYKEILLLNKKHKDNTLENNKNNNIPKSEEEFLLKNSIENNKLKNNFCNKIENKKDELNSENIENKEDKK